VRHLSEPAFGWEDRPELKTSLALKAHEGKKVP
jgi:hypothetical protein